jgi:LPXTG-site transpeptidase (sortase) family protein
MTGSPRAVDQRWNRLSITILAAGVTALLAAGVLFVLAFTGVVGKDGYSGPETRAAFIATFPPEPTPTAQPTPSEAPIANLVIPRFEVNAPVVVRGVDANRVMETPDGPTDVAWYDFTSKPGFGSNAVFSGHVDYINYGPAVFWNIKDLVAGDTVEVHLVDGTVYTYKVYSLSYVSAEPTEEELRGIVGPSDTDQVTMITCGGAFDGHQYDQRVIVRAERVYDTVPPSADAPPTN